MLPSAVMAIAGVYAFWLLYVIGSDSPGLWRLVSTWLTGGGHWGLVAHSHQPARRLLAQAVWPPGVAQLMSRPVLYLRQIALCTG